MGLSKFKLDHFLRWGHPASVITELSIGNFKAFGEPQRVPIKPLTLIFGANSSGKSSIIHSLLLAHHARETGDFDVQQTRLAGDMVDLGGFRNYVHKHDLSSSVTLHFETAIDRKDVESSLAGQDEEVAPFCELSRFGLGLELAASDPTLKAVKVLLDRQPALTFSHVGSARFRAQVGLGSHPFLDRLIRSVMEFSRVQKLPRIRIVPEQASLEEQAQDKQKHEAALERIKELFRSGQAPTREEMIRFKKVFADVLAKDHFSFSKFVLHDPRPEQLRSWPSGMGQLLEGVFNGVLGFFEEVPGGPSSDEGWSLALAERPPASKKDWTWWAEAQALRFNLSNLIMLCTKQISEALHSFAYLGPMRSVPARHLTVQGVQDPKLLAGGSLAWELACQNPGVIGAVNKWFGPERLGSPYRLGLRRFLDAGRVEKALEEGTYALEELKGPADLTELVFEDIRAETVLSHRDVGFGIGQVLPGTRKCLCTQGELGCDRTTGVAPAPGTPSRVGRPFHRLGAGRAEEHFSLGDSQ